MGGDLDDFLVAYLRRSAKLAQLSGNTTSCRKTRVTL